MIQCPHLIQERGIFMSNEFLSGSYQFNNSPLYNFQLNRVVLWNHGDLAEVAARGKEITDFASWERVLKELSYQAERRKDWAAAAGYLRMAEFFMVPDTPESRDVYDRAQELFYANFAHLFSPQGGPIHRDEVPYESGTLPCWRITPSGDKRGTILFHGGNDSLLEEFTDLLLYLARGGYEILAFEGPGQGAALRKSGLTFTPEWEKPVGAVLDFYGAEDVTIVGVSLGGELAMRAAAMEPHIRRVVAWCVLPSIYGALMADKPAEIRTTLEQLLSEKQREKVLALYTGLSEQNPLFRWSIQHANYAYGTADVYEYLQRAKAFTIEPVADQITQDVLLISAREDLMVGFDLYKEEIDLLKSARTLEFAVPGAAIHGQAHCNMGNPQYILDLILNWNNRLLQ